MGLFGSKAPVRDELQELLDSTGETKLIAVNDNYTFKNVLVVTDTRSLIIRKSRIEKNLPHSEVARTRILQTSNDMIVIIETFKCLRDFMPDDHKRWPHFIQVGVDTPGIAQDICREIDSRSG